MTFHTPRSWFSQAAHSPGIQASLLFLVIVAIKGHPVPEPVTEYLYLPRMMHQYQPYILNDWTLASPAYEHIVFNASFGWLTLLFSLEVVGWLGRILVWIAFSLGFLQLGAKLRLPPWMTALATVLWLLYEQSVVASSWMVGGLEAKVVSYAFLLASLNLFLSDRQRLGAFLLGLSFSFHPAIGLWGGLAAGFALLCLRAPFPRLLQLAGLVIAGALPGLIATGIHMTHSEAIAPNAWKFFALVQAPQHLDPQSWPLRDTLLVYILFAFNTLFALRHRDDRPLQFLLWFQIALGLFFTMGLVWRWTGSYALLGYTPFRLFPLFVPLLFLLFVMRAYHQPTSRLGAPALVLALIGLMSFGNPLGRAVDHINTTRKRWRGYHEDVHKALRWLRTHTAPTSVAIQPPWLGETFHLSRRGQIANWWANRYDKFDEWKARLEAMVGTIPPSKTEAKLARMKKHYNTLSPGQIKDLIQKYGADYLVSQGTYSYPVRFRTPTYKVYDLRHLAPTTRRR